MQDIRVEPSSGKLRFWVQWTNTDGGRWAQLADLKAAEGAASTAGDTEGSNSGKAKKAKSAAAATAALSAGVGVGGAETGKGAKAKRTLTSYQLFSAAERSQLANELPGSTFGEVAAALGERWRALADEERAVYEARAAELKQQGRDAADAEAVATAAAGSSERRKSGGSSGAAACEAKAMAPEATATVSEKARRKRPLMASSPEPNPSEAQVSRGASEPPKRQRDGKIAPSSGRWERSNPQASDAWEAALDAMQPEEGEDGEAERPPPPRAAPARDPRMAGFRIGGQAETAEERGEGWCGPWSTAMRLVEQREQAKRDREEAMGGDEPPPLAEWKPSRGLSAPRPQRVAPVPRLQDLAVRFLADHISEVDCFGVLSPGDLHALALRLCERRKFTEDVLPLFTSDPNITELILPDLHLVPEEGLLEALERIVVPGAPNLPGDIQPARPPARPLASA